jgi:hypothetical protein
LRQEDIGRISLLENQFHSLNDQLDTRFTSLNAKFETLIDVISGGKSKGKGIGKGRGRGKTGKNSLNTYPPQDSAQFYGFDGSLPGSSRRAPHDPSTRLSDIFTEDESVQQSLRGSVQESTPSLRSELRLGSTKTVHLTKIQCLLNNAPIDMIEDFQSEDECMQAYWRLFTFNSQMNSLFTNGITYDEFR